MRGFPLKTGLVLVITASLLAAVPVARAADENAAPAAKEQSAFATLLDDYLAIQTALAGDSTDGVGDHALAIERVAHRLENTPDPADAGIGADDSAALKKLLPNLVKNADEVAKAQNLASARKAFGPLSDSMIAYRDLATGERPGVAYCPMAKESWLQAGDKIANPYYGSSMLRCGSFVKKHESAGSSK